MTAPDRIRATWYATDDLEMPKSLSALTPASRFWDTDPHLVEYVRADLAAPPSPLRKVNKMTNKLFVVKAVNIVEHDDGSATYSFDLDNDSQESLCKIGLEFVIYCAAHELDLGYVLDNLKRLKSE